MGKRKPMSRAEWLAELAYIDGVDSDDLRTAFNLSRECFDDYVRMQARFAAEDGFDQIASEMLAHTATKGVTP